MKRHMENTRASLGELHGLAAKTEAAERNILKAAQKRHAAVVSEIEHMQPGIEGAGDDVHDKYLDLVAERGQLDVVISKAQAALVE